LQILQDFLSLTTRLTKNNQLNMTNAGVIKRFLALLLAVTAVGLCEEAPDQKRIKFPPWAFCIAYQVRDPDKRDARPEDPKAEKDPFSEGGTWIPHGLMNDRNVVDVAALSTRIVKSGILKHDAAEGVVRGATNGAKRHPVMDCYNPHHLFVFYDYEGKPVAAIEVCFTCNRVKMTPEVRAGVGAAGPFESADLAGLAKIASEAGLDLKPYADLDQYVQRLDEITKRISLELEKLGAGKTASFPELKSEGSDKAQPQMDGGAQ
jgi:hypothetical protein